MVNRLGEFISIIKKPVIFGIHHFRNRDLDPQIPFTLQAVIAGIDFLPECFRVILVFQITKTFYGSLFWGSVWIRAVAFCNPDLSFDRTIFKCFFIFTDHGNLQRNIIYAFLIA